MEHKNGTENARPPEKTADANIMNWNENNNDLTNDTVTASKTFV